MEHIEEIEAAIEIDKGLLTLNLTDETREEIETHFFDLKVDLYNATHF